MARRPDVPRAIFWGVVATALLASLIVLGSRNLRHFDAALVGYTFATLFAAFGITYRYAMAPAAADPDVLAAGVAGVRQPATARRQPPHAREAVRRRGRRHALYLPPRRRARAGPLADHV